VKGPLQIAVAFALVGPIGAARVDPGELESLLDDLESL
jgi:hypothetical protein